jgi:hypothetical protein
VFLQSGKKPEKRAWLFVMLQVMLQMILQYFTALALYVTGDLNCLRRYSKDYSLFGRKA